MERKNLYSSDVHPKTEEQDGKWRYTVTFNDKKWTIFPMACSLLSLEQEFSKYKIFSHPSLTMNVTLLDANGKFDDEDATESEESETNPMTFYFHPYSGTYPPLCGFLSFNTRKTVLAGNYLTHDHIHIFLAIMTWNYMNDNWQRCAFLSIGMSS